MQQSMGDSYYHDGLLPAVTLAAVTLSAMTVAAVTLAAVTLVRPKGDPNQPISSQGDFLKLFLTPRGLFGLFADQRGTKREPKGHQRYVLDLCPGSPGVCPLRPRRIQRASPGSIFGVFSAQNISIIAGRESGDLRKFKSINFLHHTIHHSPSPFPRRFFFIIQ